MMLSTLVMTIATVGSGPSTTPVPRTGGHAARHHAINKVVQSKAGDVDVVFVGDSITQGWEGAGASVWGEHYAHRKAANLGISGDRTEHVLWRLRNGNLEGITPKVAVVMIGTNNIGHGGQQTREVLDGVRAVVECIRAISPHTRVLLLDIFPRGHSFNADRGRITQINQALAKMHDGDAIVFLSIGHHFVMPDGTISPEVMPDGLHLSQRGYRIWQEAMEPTLRGMLATTPEAESP